MPNKSCIVLIDEHPSSRAQLQQLLLQSRFIVADGVGYDDEALALASQLKPQIILIALEEPAASALETIQSLTDVAPNTPIIVYSSLRDSESVRRAKLAGAWDYLTRPVKAKDLSTSIERALNGQSEGAASEDEPEPEAPGNGTIITIFGAKGGVGKTLLAVNLAAAMAKTGSSTVAVDLDTVFGDVAKMMKITGDKDFVGAARHAAELNEWTVDTYLTQHPSGVKLLPAPREPTDWQETDPEAVDKLLSLLAKVHEFIIIDTPATFTDLVVLALRRADIIFLVTSLDPTSIDDTAIALKIVGASPAALSKIKLTLNRPAPTNGLTEDEVAQKLGQEIFWSLPYDKDAGYCDEVGRPVVLSRPKAKISRRIAKMTALLAGLRSPTSPQAKA